MANWQIYKAGRTGADSHWNAIILESGTDSAEAVWLQGELRMILNKVVHGVYF